MARIPLGRAQSPAGAGLLLLILASLLGLLDSLFNYFWTGNGIHGTAGALLVIVSTALQLLAAVLIYTGVLRGWAKALFEVLILLDLIGTFAAAYLLEAWVLVVLTVIAAIGWIVQVGWRRGAGAREVVS